MQGLWHFSFIHCWEQIMLLIYFVCEHYFDCFKFKQILSSSSLFSRLADWTNNCNLFALFERTTVSSAFVSSEIGFQAIYSWIVSQFSSILSFLTTFSDSTLGLYRRSQTISQQPGKEAEEVLQLALNKTECAIVVRRQFKHLSHVLIHSSLLKDVMDRNFI